jgi:hypothetical protein
VGREDDLGFIPFKANNNRSSWMTTSAPEIDSMRLSCPEVVEASVKFGQNQQYFLGFALGFVRILLFTFGLWPKYLIKAYKIPERARYFNDDPGNESPSRVTRGD